MQECIPFPGTWDAKGSPKTCGNTEHWDNHGGYCLGARRVVGQNQHLETGRAVSGNWEVPQEQEKGSYAKHRRPWLGQSAEGCVAD